MGKSAGLFGPFGDQRCPMAVIVQPDLSDLRRVVQSIEIGMDQRQAHAWRLVQLDDRRSWATAPRRHDPAPNRIARASVVLPAPSVPLSATTSPGRSAAAICRGETGSRGQVGQFDHLQSTPARLGHGRSTIAVVPAPSSDIISQLAAMRLDQLAGQRQAKAMAAVQFFPVDRQFNPVKRPGQRRRVHPGAIVRDDNTRPVLTLGAAA